ncbi:DUF1292 domain-containing protein [Clostridium sardiniense]|uniref:DUF1292 domain-containing protein n=1 Tax=Clostridium sardiniense TaxID=29369 RepID=UPI00195C7C03|nr:DUF1292 domain-containing protein [Clostridium sardiniense]MBM7833745.1 hypothetical protein [Clostridium sardiniense]
MSDKKIMTFRDENNNKIDYEILEQVLISGSEYVALAPVTSHEKIELFKIKFDKDWNESLEEVSSEKEINMFKQVSKLKM